MHIFITVLLLLISFFFRSIGGANITVMSMLLSTTLQHLRYLLASNDKLFEIIIIRAMLFVINISIVVWFFYSIMVPLLAVCSIHYSADIVPN